MAELSPDIVATHFLVPGRGLQDGPEGQPELTSAARQRVERLDEYLTEHDSIFGGSPNEQADDGYGDSTTSIGAVAVFSGGWAAERGGPPPDIAHREGNLMLEYAKERKLHERFPPRHLPR
jgi:hypothetical protein